MLPMTIRMRKSEVKKMTMKGLHCQLSYPIYGLSNCLVRRPSATAGPLNF